MKLKVHSLTGRITPLLMYQAFRNVKRNRGAAGIDNVSIRMFEANLFDNLDALMRELKTRGTFKPKPLRRVFIPKGKGKMRPLGIPAVRDRIAQEVLSSTCCVNQNGQLPVRGTLDEVARESCLGLKQARR